ncbi:MAG: aspartate kinase [Bacteroidales bacterium]|nr:aspartate kinase [Bacteroidales bacterium]MBN2821488.1 aspartate kinase [Bacteroidales bacterium]
MKVFKFGGASVKDAHAVKNLASILKTYEEPLVVVVSAMGKMTNAMEKVVNAYFKNDNSSVKYLDDVRDFHWNILKDLFPEDHSIYKYTEEMLDEVRYKLLTDPSMNYNFEYDQIVSYGELLSTKIISEYLEYIHIENQWIDIRKILKTDDIYREANVDFEISAHLAKDVFLPSGNLKYLTQGFIGSNKINQTTTLGREGSDYTGALIASFVGAESFTVWKDVPGILNADPKWFSNTVKLEKLTYTDAIELAFYGASVLHPKTIQPVKQNNIPLYVKSFLNPEEEGSVIGNFNYEKLVPCFIFKVDQVLIKVHPKDLSFIAEHNLKRIFSIMAKYSLRANLMQNTAVSFRICVNNDSSRILPVVEELEKHYKITTEEDLELITIRYYDQQTIDRVLINKEVLLEQHNQMTVQMVVRKL